MQLGTLLVHLPRVIQAVAGALLKPRRSYGSQNHLYLILYGLFYHSGVLILIFFFSQLYALAQIYVTSWSKAVQLIEQMSASIMKPKISYCFRGGEKSTSRIACFCLNLKENFLVVMDIKLQSYVLAHRSPNDLFQMHPSAGFFFFLCRELQSWYLGGLSQCLCESYYYALTPFVSVSWAKRENEFCLV